MLTVKLYGLQRAAAFQVVGIHDGWRPLCVRCTEEGPYLAALVDTNAREEAEVFRCFLPEDDIGAVQEREGVELAFIGSTHDGWYLFLDVKPEGPKPGRLDLEDFLKKGVDKSRKVE